MANSNAYEQAYKAAMAASARFRAVQAAYRAQQIGDAEYLAARAIYEASEAAFDAAYQAEQEAN